MRVIAGSLGGRVLDAPLGQRTHPMSERMRGALFNTLGDVSGLTVIDAFAGSGALGFEAISRGAASVVAIERDRVAQRCIEGNTARLAVSKQVTLIKTSVDNWLRTTSDQHDLVLCDPPYEDLQLETLQRLAERLRPNGLLVLSWPSKQIPPIFNNLQQTTAHSYGDAQLIYYTAGE